MLDSREDDQENESISTSAEPLKKKIKVETVIPSAGGTISVPPYPAKPAKTYPFELDSFQRESICWLETGDSVLVSAHTSAGKTVVAEYAIAMCLRDSKRVIYTSPLKALSNQKYRDLSNEFPNMGLMTGDVTINPNADCLVMTTEILRSMLYRGNEMLREVGCVIFDEIHYMRDKSRGVVWEETIILLPDAVQYVFLSATIPNAQELANWIAHIHPGQTCRVVYTDFRPTPLQHYVYPGGAEGIYCVIDQEGNFKSESYKRAMETIAPSSGSGGGPPDANTRVRNAMQQNKSHGRSNIFKLVQMLTEKNLAPCIVFSFSKRECEALGLQLTKLDLTTDEEKQLISEVFTNAMDSLSEDDKKLAQVQHIQPLLRRGIGIHHSGLLPILKELIEILFQEGLIKVLFSTETFSMGLNMPARTVIFTQVRKFDGDTNRWLTSGEYIQMSGRAGRRGLDEFGISILMIDEQMEADVMKQMMSGKPDPLLSAFHLTYNMILNLLRVEEVDPEYLMSRSFYQFQVDNQLPHLEKELKELEEERKLIIIPHEEVVSEYHSIRTQLANYREQVRLVMTSPKYALSFLQSGRVLYIKDGNMEYGWCICLSFRLVRSDQQQQSQSQQQQQKLSSPPTGDSATTSSSSAAKDTFLIDVLCWCAPSSSNTSPSDDVTESGGAAKKAASAALTGRPQPYPLHLSGGNMKVLDFDLGCIQKLSAMRIKVPESLLEQSVLDGMRTPLQLLFSKFAPKESTFHSEIPIPLLDPVEDMKITDTTFHSVLRKIEALEDRIGKNEVHQTKNRELLEAYQRFEKKTELTNTIEELKRQIKASKKTVLRDELKARLRILRRLEYTNEDNVIQTKGRVACEMNASDELLTTELIFSGLFNDLTPDQIAALMSCLVYTERTNAEFNPSESFQKPLQKLYDICHRIIQVSTESKLPLEESKELEKISPALVDVTLAWAKGQKFSEVCAMTEVYEGTIIRMLRRLEELLRQMAGAARGIGDESLCSKFLESITKIKRDIVFAASLYL